MDTGENETRILETSTRSLLITKCNFPEISSSNLVKEMNSNSLLRPATHAFHRQSLLSRNVQLASTLLTSVTLILLFAPTGHSAKLEATRFIDAAWNDDVRTIEEIFKRTRKAKRTGLLRGGWGSPSIYGGQLLGESAQEKGGYRNHVFTPLVAAITNDSHDALKTLISFGVEMQRFQTAPIKLRHRTDEYSVDVGEPLMLAAAQNNVEAVKMLIADGAKFDREYKTNMVYNGSGHNPRKGRDPIYYACMYGSLDVVVHLVELGADIEKRYKGKYLNINLIHEAANSGHADVVSFLIEKGASTALLRERPAAAGALAHVLGDHFSISDTPKALSYYEKARDFYSAGARNYQRIKANRIVWQHVLVASCNILSHYNAKQSASLRYYYPVARTGTISNLSIYDIKSVQCKMGEDICRKILFRDRNSDNKDLRSIVNEIKSELEEEYEETESAQTSTVDGA